MALLKRMLHGIEAGIVGGLAMLGLLAAASMWHRHVWWEIPNLLGSTFYHSRAFYSGLGKATLAGAALQLTTSGLLGAIFGLTCGHVRSRHRLILLGTLTGLGWFFLGNALVWPRVNPMIPYYWPEPAAVLSHLLFGACLGYGGNSSAPPALIPDGANGPSDAVES
jgi:hypothetical protein